MENLYIGKVIYDSDLLGDDDNTPKNRVKVFINGVSSAGDENFKQPRGITNENTITPQSLDVVGKDVYAYVMQPIMGSGSGAQYNASTDILTVADSGDINDLNAQPPAEAYTHVNDGFIGGNNIGTAGVNVTAMAYSPDNRSNAYKGMMSLPGVGASVVVSFINGQRGTPIIIGVLPSIADVASIHGVGLEDEVYPNYRFAYSNKKAESEDE
tara:strand:- start:1712 stop:2347 length:636 start_codon:yes stop_codon:yes gene_type:complete